MGTSSSYTGPTGPPPPLLPPWAVDPISPPPVPEPPPGQPPPSQPPPVQLAPPGASNWRAPKAAATRFARGTGSLGSVARSYVRASGGPRQAAATAVSGRTSTARIGGLASALARGGIAEAATRLGLAALLGRDAQTVLATLLDWIAPAGALREESISRIAAIETLNDLFGRLEVERNGVEALNNVTADDARLLVAMSITNYVDARFQQELVSRVEQSAVTEQAANQLSREIREFVETNVRLDLSGTDVMQMDWEGAEGKRFVDGQYLKAYELLGGAG